MVAHSNVFSALVSAESGYDGWRMKVTRTKAIKARSVQVFYSLLFLWILISMGYYIAGAVALREEFFHSAKYSRQPFELKDNGLTITNLKGEAKDAGLADGDVLQSLNGKPYTGDFQRNTELRHRKPGDYLEVEIETPSSQIKTARIRLAAREGPDFPLSGLIAFLIPVLGAPLLGLLVGFWVVAARPHDLNAWLVLMLLSFTEILFGNLDWSFWTGAWYVTLGAWRIFLTIMAFPALLWLGLYFPEQWRLDRRWPWIKWFILAVAVFELISNVFVSAIQNFDVRSYASVARLDFLIHRIGHTLQVLCILIFLAAIFDKLRSASIQDSRRRLRVLAIGSGLSLGPLLVIFGILPYLGYDPGHSMFEIIIPLVALFPLTLAYVVVVQRAMDVRILLRMGTKYLLARVTLITLELAVAAFLVVRFVVPMMQRREHAILNGVLVTLIAVALFRAFAARDSVSGRLQRWLDRRFFREAYNSEVVLSELAEHTRKFTDKKPLIETVAARISAVLHVPRIAVWLRTSNEFSLQQSLGTVAAFPGPIVLAEQSATVQNLARSGRPLTLYRDRPEEWFLNAEPEEKELLGRIGAELLLPLPGRERLIGLMMLGPKKSEEPYTPTDLRVLQSLATQTGQALEITELAHSLAREAAQRERNEREMEIAREVQQRLFPQQIPQIAGLSLAGMCRPALGVGGDYYDLIELDDGRLGLAIGDVSGKGISAALLMASLRASLRGMTLDGPSDLARMMQKVNRLVYEASANNRYATFFFATYDPAVGELRYVNAGHNPPLLIRRGSTEIVRLDAGGMVVGLLPSTDYVEQVVRVSSGDLLILYTDGISEAMTVDDEEWGEERMLDCAAQCRQDASAPDVLNAIFHSADEFTAAAPQHDDMTLLIMKLE
jgi:sigma-B regulation protein RsbU (phosphoserine phosphatase)